MHKHEHHLHPQLTTWHITWGTYGSRLHGGDRPTVDKTHNTLGDPFIQSNKTRQRSAHERMKFPPVFLTREQQLFIESIMPSICARGGWELRTCAAGPDHVHVLLDIDPDVHGEKVRRLLKRWIGQELSARGPLPDGAVWWAEEGSNKAVHDPEYLNNVFPYVFRQRATVVEGG